MEKLFENKTTYNKETYFEFLEFHNKKFNFRYTLYTVVWSMIFMLCIYLAFASKNRIQGVIVTMILVGFIAYRLLRPKKVVDKELKSDKISTNNSNTFSFYDKNFEVKNNNGSFIYRYFMLKKIYETDNYFYLYVTRENAFLISKNTFSIGTSEDFSKFLKKKCGVKFKGKK